MPRLIHIRLFFLALPFTLSCQANEPLGSGHLELYHSNATTPIEALILYSDAKINITAMTAEITLTQSFKNPSNHWANGVYVFPLPENAAVHEFSLHIGERVIQGVVQEKVLAQAQFQQAKKAGKQAALIAASRPNLFRLSIANIAPGAEVRATLVYLQTVDYQHGLFSLRLPTTLTPRYIPHKIVANSHQEPHIIAVNGWANSVPSIPDPAEISPPQVNATAGQNQISIQANLQPGIPLAQIASPSHEILWQAEQDHWQVRLAKTSIAMNRDFILTWSATNGHSPVAAAFTEQKGDSDYVAIMLIPPHQTSKAVVSLPREIIFVVDSSGSMSGVSMRQAKHSLLSSLRRLKPEDHFNLIDFDDTARALFTASVAATPQRIEDAVRFVHALEAEGGTELRTALDLIFSTKPPKHRLRQVVFITDGSIGNETELLALIKQSLGQSRLFTVGIGSAPNSYFMRRAAQFGRGSFTYIADVTEVKQQISTLFQQLEHPVLRDISLKWPDGSQVEVFPSRIPDLYFGQPLILKAKLKNKIAGGQLIVSGTRANHSWQHQLTLPKQGNTNNVAVLWAHAKITDLMDQLTLGEPETRIKSAIIQLAKSYQLASQYTSFIAVESKPTRPLKYSSSDQVVPNLIPAGSNIITPWPATATSARLNLYLGLILLFGCVISMWIASVWTRRHHHEVV